MLQPSSVLNLNILAVFLCCFYHRVPIACPECSLFGKCLAGSAQSKWALAWR